MKGFWTTPEGYRAYTTFGGVYMATLSGDDDYDFFPCPSLARQGLFRTQRIPVRGARPQQQKFFRRPASSIARHFDKLFLVGFQR